MMSPDWFHYFQFGTAAGDVVLTMSGGDHPDLQSDFYVTVIDR